MSWTVQPGTPTSRLVLSPYWQSFPPATYVLIPLSPSHTFLCQCPLGPGRKTSTLPTNRHWFRRKSTLVRSLVTAKPVRPRPLSAYTDRFTLSSLKTPSLSCSLSRVLPRMFDPVPRTGPGQASNQERGQSPSRGPSSSQVIYGHLFTRNKSSKLVNNYLSAVSVKVSSASSKVEKRHITTNRDVTVGET